MTEHAKRLTPSVTDLRQCLIYDSHEQDAKLIGVEYMVPKEVYETFDAAEQKLWHSHEYEARSGMLICPKPDGFTNDEWEAAELQAMQEVINLYGKTWHFWQVDVGRQYPLGPPVLMGSVTSAEKLDLGAACARRNEIFGVDHVRKAEACRALQEHGLRDHPHRAPTSIAFTVSQKHANTINVQTQIAGGSSRVQDDDLFFVTLQL
ncbi:hypothetical protein LTR17_027657, partial [Elasticomyces elasticus]